MVETHNISSDEIPEPEEFLEDTMLWPLDSRTVGGDAAVTTTSELERVENQSVALLESHAVRGVWAVRKSGPKVQFFGRALSDVVASSEGEISVNQGDLVAVFSIQTSDNKESEWWYCETIDGKQGYLPKHSLIRIQRRARTSRSQAIKLKEILAAIAETGTPWARVMEAFDDRIGSDPGQMPLEDFLAWLQDSCLWMGTTLIKRQSAVDDNIIDSALKAARVSTPSLPEHPEDNMSLEEKNATLIKQVEEMQARLATYQTKAASDIPTSGIEGVVRFVDAIGRKFSFPFRLCNTWAVGNTLNLMEATGLALTNIHLRAWRS
jgi:hypothetical protein